MGRLREILKKQKVAILDGGLATSLENAGHNLNDPLWSARVLLSDPAAIQEVHAQHLRSGADIITTATYQASVQGFGARGLAASEGRQYLHLAVDLACQARDAFWTDERINSGRFRPLVAASIGPYGAYLADGSEYRGDYQISDEQLKEFHRPRWDVLARGPADLLACETLPSGQEARVLVGLLRETPHRQAWFSFSCQDGHRLGDGTPLREAALYCDACPQVVALGVNCSSPSHIASLISEVREVTAKPVIVYPNLGEKYDAKTQSWRAGSSDETWLDLAEKWAALGAEIIGGCCRIGPEMIAQLRKRILG